MSTSIDETPVVPEEVWQAWLEKGKREEVTRVRNVQILACCGTVIVAAVIYVLRSS